MNKEQASLARQEAQRQKLLAALNHRRRKRPDDKPRPVRAAVLARYIGLDMSRSRENYRRAVRRCIHALRAEGHPIMSCGSGYWLGENTEDHSEYQAFRRSMGIYHLAATSMDKKCEATCDCDGQLGLF